MPDNLRATVEDVVTGRVAVRVMPQMDADAGFRWRAPVWIA